MTPRAWVAIGMLLVVGAGLWWIADQAPDPARPAGAFDVYVVGPTSLLYNGTVDVDQADALRVLQALGERERFSVQVDDLEGCSYDYVRGVAGYGETSTGGWNYYLRTDGDWEWQGHAASCGGLRAGDDVLWCWVEPDERCAVYP